MPACIRATDWPQWRGPFFNGSTDETDLPDSWGETENVIWISPLPGPSGATPVICNGRIFVSSMVGKGPDFVALSFDARDGRKLWERPIGSDSRRFPRNNMTSPSPVADGKNVFFLFGSGDLVGFDYEGNELWSRNIQTEYGNLALKFGYSSSPFLYRNKLFILVIRRVKPYQRPEADGPLDSYLMALNPQTGETLWKKPRPTNAFDEGMETYSTPIPFVRAGRTEILNTGADFITAHDPDTGTELWRFEYQTTKVRDSRVIPSLVAGDGLIFGARHKHNGVFVVEPGGPDNPSEARIVWEFNSPVPDCSTPLFYRGRLYVLDGIKNGKVVTCLDPKTGRQFWQGKIGGRGPWRASLTGADGKLYCINETGEIIVLAAGGDEFKILFETKTDETPIQSSIAVANGRLFIRTAKNLHCIGKEGRPHRAAPTALRGQGDAPYPPSPVIKGIEWAPVETIVRRASGSDNWPTTWADDGNLYSAYGDGWGFEPKTEKKLSLGIVKITGGPTDFHGVNVRTETGERIGQGANGAKASGMLMVDGVLYMLVRNTGNSQVAWSNDHGRTWTWCDWKFQAGFGAPAFLNFGRNYAGARDRFVYIYSHNAETAYDPADEMVMARVPKSEIRNRSAYEFFKGLDDSGRPVWTKNIRRRGAVFTNPGKCYRSQVSYNAGIKRYLWCQVLPTSKHPQGMRFQGGFGIYDAPEPWGPWTTVFYTEEWDVGPGETNSFPTRWISDDGRTCHLVFSGDDCFSVRKATLTVTE